MISLFRSKSRTAVKPGQFGPEKHTFTDSSGRLQRNAPGRLVCGYRTLYESDRITEAACRAHARRKIHDVIYARAPTNITTEAYRCTVYH
ncbi:TPA: transposase [Escherichia coli]|nr:transposase [Escherichia coli]HAW4297352.1 transposase [Escherichia coli]HCP8550601.1 transposase [Escherichia coli]HCQ8900014.1 transposase [Escherichia coli]HCQ9035421.1 transposase [Escherichia coli]